MRFAALADHLFGRRRISGKVIAHEDVIHELRKLGFLLPAENVVAIPNTGFTRARIGAAAWVILHVLRSNYRHVHLASNPSPLSWTFALLRRKLPCFSVSVVDSRVSQPDRWMRALRHASSIDCLSPSIAGKIVEREPDLALRLKVAPCSFPARPAASGSAVPDALPVRDIDLLFVSRFVAGKGIELLNAVGRDLSDLKVRIAGSGPYRPCVAEAILGPEEDIPGLMLRSKIFLSLQLETNYPSQAVYEAVRARCALIVTDTGDTRRFLDDDCAMLVSPQPEAIVTAARQLLADTKRMTRLTENAAVVLQDHTVDGFAQYFLDEVIERPDCCG